MPIIRICKPIKRWGLRRHIGVVDLKKISISSGCQQEYTIGFKNYTLNAKASEGDYNDAVD